MSGETDVKDKSAEEIAAEEAEKKLAEEGKLPEGEKVDPKIKALISEIDKGEVSLEDYTEEELNSLKESNPEYVDAVDELLEKKTKPEPKDDLIPMSKVQERIDNLTALVHEQAEVIKQLKETGTGGKKNTWDDYSDADLRALKKENPDYEETVDKILEDRRTKRLKEELRNEGKVENQIDLSYQRIEDEFPEYAKQGTPEWNKANEVFIRENLKNTSNGPYIAAVLAFNELNKGKTKTITKLSKQLDKERAKKNLATGKMGKGAPTGQAYLDKLFEKAQGTDATSPEWRVYLKALRASKNN